MLARARALLTEEEACRIAETATQPVLPRPPRALRFVPYSWRLRFVPYRHERLRFVPYSWRLRFVPYRRERLRFVALFVAITVAITVCALSPRAITVCALFVAITVCALSPRAITVCALFATSDYGLCLIATNVCATYRRERLCLDRHERLCLEPRTCALFVAITVCALSPRTFVPYRRERLCLEPRTIVP